MKEKLIVPISMPEVNGKISKVMKKAVLLEEYVKFWLVGVLDRNEKEIIFKTCVCKDEIDQRIKEEKTRTLKELLG